jgi:SAM-dependent methyltransferase
MAQNIYDEESFFAGYSNLPRSLRGLDGAPEWPTLRRLLPPLNGRRVIDLGCGFGWFCRWAAEQGAASVLGIDLSSNMLERAREMGGPATIRYQQSDLDEVTLPPFSADIFYSSLAFHYHTNLERLWQQVAAALTPGGAFVFSVEHPMFTAPTKPIGDGWMVDGAGRSVWPIDSYLVEGRRTREWFTPGVIKQHRTMATYLNTLTATGFRLVELVEWGPNEDELKAHPELAEERDRPTFLLVSAVKG